MSCLRKLLDFKIIGKFKVGLVFKRLSNHNETSILLKNAKICSFPGNLMTCSFKTYHHSLRFKQW